MTTNKVKVFALGGLCEVGKNMYCIEQDEEIIIIDAGIGFPDSINDTHLVLPDFTYLKQNEEKIVGLFITHGHEDHIGGIPFLLSTIHIPHIYTNGFTTKLINSKIKDCAFDFDITNLLVEYNDDSVFSFNHFTISFFRTNHSISDSFGIIINTEFGNILHTGDFKFDLTPISNEFDYYKVSKLRKENVLLLLSDSTNANITKPSISEKRVSANLKNQFSHIKGRIIISTFASNTVRISQIIEAANHVGRKIAIFGKSIEKSISIATSLKYLKPPKDIFILPEEIDHIDDNKILILSTGTQGEPLASLVRIANGTHKNIKIKNGDTVIFSSSSIPGNQARINEMINKLYIKGADVITNSPLTDVHSSGHANANELQLMLNLCKPKYFMPIHGEYAMLYRHAELANEVGIKPKNCFIMNNGDILNITDKAVYVKGKIPNGNIYIGQNNKVIDNNILRERKMLSESGIVFFTIPIDIEHNGLLRWPDIVSRGFIHNKQSHDLISKILYEVVKQSSIYFNNHNMFVEEEFNDFIKSEMEKFIFDIVKAKPEIVPIILKH
ncbi:MAG: ribonuclease J [Bacilli bacterium]|nr:ribonuclease J [Bacilli bacterium]